MSHDAAMSAALAHTCTCGRRHLVSVGTPRDAGWHDAIAGVAAQLEASYVDGRRTGFLCAGCGTVFVRGGTPATVVEHADALAHTFVLN